MMPVHTTHFGVILISGYFCFLFSSHRVFGFPKSQDFGLVSLKKSLALVADFSERADGFSGRADDFWERLDGF